MISPRLVNLIAMRDFWAIVQTKSFLIGLAAFAFIASVMPVVGLLSTLEPHNRVTLVDKSGRYGEQLRARFAESKTLDFVSGPAAERLRTAQGEAAEEALRTLHQQVRSKQVDGLIVIGESAEAGEERVTFSTANLADTFLHKKLKDAITQLQRQARAARLGIATGQLDQLMAAADFQLERVTDRPQTQKANEFDVVFAVFIPVVLVFALYGLISFQSERLLTALMEEKLKRLLEVLLTRANIYELLAGKMLGILYVGLLLYVGVLVLLIGAAAALGFLAFITAKTITFFTLFYAAGYALYASFYAAIGAACSHPKDAENLSMPLRMLLVVPIMISVYVNINPNAPASLFCSYFPLTAPFVMTNRMMVMQVPAWQLGLSLVVVLAAAAVGLWVATRIFQASLLAGSRTLGPREIWRSLTG
ncbi:MAG: ABC transporter permease [Verrucomicrobiota bacterium]